MPEVWSVKSTIASMLRYLLELKTWRFLAVVSILSVVRCVAVFVAFVWLTPPTQPWVGYSPDSLVYEAIASNLLSGAGYSMPPYHPTMIKEPLYPVIIAAIKWTFDLDQTGLVALQILTNPLIAILVYFLGMELFDKVAARLSSLFIAVMPVYGVLSFWILTEHCFIILFLATVLVLVRATRSNNWGLYMLSGGLLGLSALSRNIVVPLAILYPIALMVCHDKLSKKTVARNILLFLLAFVLFTTPWMFRNKEKLGLFSISARGGQIFSHQAAWAANATREQWKAYGLYVISGELAQKRYPAIIGQDFAEFEESVLMRRAYLNGLLAKYKEGEVDRILIQEALHNLWEHPFKFALLSFMVDLQSVKYMVPGTLTEIKGPHGWAWLVRLIKVSLLVLGVVLTVLTVKALLHYRHRLCQYSLLVVPILFFHIALACVSLGASSISRHILPVTVFYPLFITSVMARRMGEVGTEGKVQ